MLIMIVCGVMAMRIIFLPNEDVTAPSLVGQSAIDAVKRLEGLGLTAQIDQVESDQPEGVVISQNIEPGQKTAKGRKIIIKVSKGGSQVQIPDVRGMEFATAVKTLDSAGFKVGTVLKVSDQLKTPGTIIAQNPAAPAMVPGNRMVDLLISEGKEGKAEMVQVPDLQGQTEELAKQILEQSDLTFARSILIRSDVVPVGNIVRTQPRAGARVPSGQAVTIYLAQAASSVDVSAPPATGTEPSVPQPQTPEPAIATTPASTPERPVQETQQPDTTSSTATQSTPAPTPSTPPAQTAPQTPVATQPESGVRKTAKVRYQVPPLSRPLSLKIEMADQNGSRVLKEEQAKGGEYLTIDAPYAGTASVTIHLGGELVWQEKYQ